MTYALTNGRTNASLPARLATENNHFKIKENSIFLKMLACVPLIGAITQNVVEARLAKKLETARDNDRLYLAKLIDVKNDFKKCGIIRNIILVATAIALLVPAIIVFGPSASRKGILMTAIITVIFIHNSKVIAKQISKNNIIKNNLAGPSLPYLPMATVL